MSPLYNFCMVNFSINTLTILLYFNYFNTQKKSVIIYRIKLRDLLYFSQSIAINIVAVL